MDTPTTPVAPTPPPQPAPIVSDELMTSEDIYAPNDEQPQQQAQEGAR